VTKEITEVFIDWFKCPGKQETVGGFGDGDPKGIGDFFKI